MRIKIKMKIKKKKNMEKILEVKALVRYILKNLA
jgi:hypothetical protein